MKLYIFHTKGTPVDQDIEYLQRRLATIGARAELVDADSRAGSALAEQYDIMQRPAVLATADDGQQLDVWQGTLPRLEDLMPYTTRS